MNKHQIRLLFGALLIVVLLVYYFVYRPTSRGEKKDKDTAGAGSPSMSNVATVASALKTNIQRTQTISSTTNRASVVTDRQKTNEIRQYMESQNRPIEFYGRIVDQERNPIPGVKVKVDIRHITVIVPAPWGDEDQIIPIERETDSAGLFEINGVTGASLAIRSVEREGYRLSPKTEDIYSYGNTPTPYRPDLQNPVIIRMWKLGEPANLISHKTLLGFQPDGRTYTLDLLADKKMEGANPNGDLQIQFRRTLILKPGETYNWELDISAVDGGLIETADEFEYLAPEGGYQPTISLQTNSVSPSAAPDMTKNYYLTSRNGQLYGVVSLQIFSDYNGQSAILVDSRVNPNGSRNLQPDRSSATRGAY
ncbi:MAG TPA: hypothetical protein VME24_06565 [Alphaproteobacteria bacterium]|nr:hypothetical protein [Alphaproteobacteria bacterium]